MATLTGANSQFTLTVQGVYSAPVTLQGYATDDAFKSEAVANSEVVMGVDGTLSGGFVFTPYKTTIMLQADSPSIDVMETWKNTNIAARDTFIANGSIFVPSINKVFTLTRGFLTNSTSFPDNKKLLQPMQYEITWNLITSAPTA